MVDRSIGINLLMGPDSKDLTFSGHIVVCDIEEWLLTKYQIFPHISLESHSLEDEAACGEEALVVIDGCHDQPADGAQQRHYGNEYKNQRGEVKKIQVFLPDAMYLHCRYFVWNVKMLSIDLKLMNKSDGLCEVLTSYYDGAINKNEWQIDAGYGQLVPVVNKKIKLDPLLRIVGERGKLLEYGDHHTHGQQYEDAQAYENAVERQRQWVERFATASDRANRHGCARFVVVQILFDYSQMKNSKMDVSRPLAIRVWQ